MNQVFPLVSIIMPTRNRCHLVGIALDSIRNQTYTAWECLVIDDDSSDGTEKVLQKYVHKDPRIRYQKRKSKYKKGISGARNQGLDSCKGNYIIFFDDDDLVHPENLRINAEILESSGTCFCHFEKRSFIAELPDHNTQNALKIYPIGPEQIEQVVSHRIPMSSCTVMWNRKCFDSIRFNEDLLYSEEWECYTRILVQGFEGVGINQVLYFNRKHPKSNTGQFWKEDPILRRSHLLAVNSIVNCLHKNKLLTHDLVRYFVQTAIFLKEKNALIHLLHVADLDLYEKIRYSLLYELYPGIIIWHRLKKKLRRFAREQQKIEHLF